MMTMLRAALWTAENVRFSGKAVLSVFCMAIMATSGFFAGDVRAAAISYDIVYVRQARYGDNTATIWPEVFHPARMEPGADLMLLHPDGTEEVLVAAGN